MKKSLKWLLLSGSVLALASICVLVCMLFGGTDRVIEQDDYDLIKKDGKSYIRLHEERDGKREYSDINIVSLSFSSVSDMKERIQDGKLSQEELQDIRQFLSINGADWKICDMDNLYDARTPDEVSTGNVSLYGLLYEINITGDDFSRSWIECYYEKSEYKERLQKDFLDFPGETVEITRVKTVEDRNATVISYETATASCKAVKYTIIQDGRTLHVCEEYVLHYKNLTGRTSEEWPKSVSIFEEKNGVYAIVNLHELLERPTVEWLTSFEMVPLNWFQRMLDF